MAKPDKHVERTERYHKEFAGRLIEKVKTHTAPWQKPCPPYTESRSRPVRS